MHTSEAITIDPEMRDPIWPLEAQEESLLEYQLLQAGRARDPLVVWRDPETGKTVLLDGHNRLRLCRKHGLKYDVVEAEGVISRADALAYVERNQLGRRNVTRHQWAYLVGGRYNREKAQGSRSDLYSGKPQSTAEGLGVEHNVSGRAIEDCGRFRTAMEYLQAVLSVDACHSIMTQDARISRAEVIQLSSLDAEAIGEVWDEWKRSGAGLTKLIAKRKQGKTPPKPGERPHGPKATDLYPLSDLVRRIAIDWTPRALADAIEAGTITPTQFGIVQQHLPGALRNLIGMAEETQSGVEVLDEWLDRQEADAAAHDDDEEPAADEKEQPLLPVPEAGERLCLVEDCDTVPEYSGRGRRSLYCLAHRKPQARENLALRS